ncbi:MAG: hypothetical protein ACR2MT_04660 [Aurantibacter sp.]
MVFLIYGNFSALLRRDFLEDLDQATVKIYLPAKDAATTDETISETKYPLEVLDEKAIGAKKKYLIGEGKTDALGNYTVNLSNEYQKGPVEINIEVFKVPNQKSKVDKTVQFVVTTLQPVWRGDEKESTYNWNYCLPGRFWCGIRGQFDAWTVFGSVKYADDRKKPFVGVKVSAYDEDWIKDDKLGSAITDEYGRFRIDFQSSDFKKTFLSPLVNVETPLTPIPGPGVYFKISSYNGKVIYDEDPSYGKLPERRNIPNCFHVDLFVDDKKGLA